MPLMTIAGLPSVHLWYIDRNILIEQSLSTKYFNRAVNKTWLNLITTSIRKILLFYSQ